MIDKLLLEVFGLTDDLNLGDQIRTRQIKPGGLQYNRDSVEFNLNNNKSTNPFDDINKIKLPNNILNQCTFFNSNTHKCAVGCDSINVKKNDKICPIYLVDNINPQWNLCPCAFAGQDVSLLDRLSDTKEKNTYDFEKADSTRFLDRKKPMSGWQHEIFECFKKRNTNLIISVPPGGGKTRPIKAYFYEKMLMFLFNRGGEMPRFIYFVPTKQLSIQIMNNDFIRDDEYGIMAILGNLQQYTKGKIIPGSDVEQRQVHTWFHDLLYREFNNDFERETFILKLAQSFIVIKSGDNPNPNYQFEPDIVAKLPFLRGKDKPIIICVKSPDLAKTVERFARNADHIIVDEMQELLSKPGMPLTKDSVGTFTQLCQIIKIAKRASTPVHLLTGSVNQTTLSKLSDGFKDILKVKFEFIPNIYRKVLVTNPDSPLYGKERPLDASNEKEMPGMKNRSKLTVVPLQALSGENSFKPQVELVKSVVRAKQTNSIMVVFSVRNFAKTSIINIMLDALKNLPARNINSLYDSPSRISIALQGSNYTDGYRQNQRLRDNDEYTVVPGQHDISRITAEREARKDIRKYDDYLNDNRPGVISRDNRNQIRSHDFEIPGMLDQRRAIIDPNDPEKKKKKMIYIDDIEFLKYFNRYELEKPSDPNIEKDKRQSVDNMTMTYDEDNVLYRGVLAGIGLMIGAMHPIHKDTIQRLFQKGKIYILLSTDALGVKFAPSNRNI